MTDKETLEKLVYNIENLSSRIPNGHFDSVHDTMKKLKEDITELKRILMNPENGAIVKINKTAEDMTSLKKRMDDIEEQTAMLPFFENWKQGVSKALWILFSAIVGIILQILLFTKQMNL